MAGKISFGLWWQKCTVVCSNLVISGSRMLEPSYISPLSVQDSTLWDGTAYIQGTPFPFDELSGNFSQISMKTCLINALHTS